MSDCKPNGKDMSVHVLIDTLDFLKHHDIGKMFILSGGEPLEHEHFDEIMDCILRWQKIHQYFKCITITTNGEKIQDDGDTYIGYVNSFREAGINLIFQVSTDMRYYPRQIKTHRRVFRQVGFVMCENCVEHMYPQGRARDNNLLWKSKASKCFNVRAITKQLSEPNLKKIEAILAQNMKFCTPSISINGDIKLGESDLCPMCASIYDDENTIMQKIKDFKCHGCDMINNKLPEVAKQFVE